MKKGAFTFSIHDRIDEHTDVEGGQYIRHAIGDLHEDDVLVRESGFEVLTDGVPKHIDEIEALMAEPGVLQKVPLAPASFDRTSPP